MTRDPNGIIVHLNQRDVTFVAVSRAPYTKLASYRERMGWSFKWVSSHDTDFNYDYHYLDLVPNGRDEAARGPYWVRRHDEY